MFDQIAEQKIAEAIARGELDDLPGAGKPLELDDDAHVPEDLRVAYRILKNAGYVPPEVDNLREIGELERFIARDGDGSEKAKLLRRIALLRTVAEARLDRRRARISRRRG